MVHDFGESGVPSPKVEWEGVWPARLTHHIQPAGGAEPALGETVAGPW